jgi:hypothetical protein
MLYRTSTQIHATTQDLRTYDDAAGNLTPGLVNTSQPVSVILSSKIRDKSAPRGQICFKIDEKTHKMTSSNCALRFPSLVGALQLSGQ